MRSKPQKHSASSWQLAEGMHVHQSSKLTWRSARWQVNHWYRGCSKDVAMNTIRKLFTCQANRPWKWTSWCVAYCTFHWSITKHKVRSKYIKGSKEHYLITSKFPGNPLCQATKHLNNSQTVKNNEKWDEKLNHLFVFAMLFSCPVPGTEEQNKELGLFIIALFLGPTFALTQCKPPFKQVCVRHNVAGQVIALLMPSKPWQL